MLLSRDEIEKSIASHGWKWENNSITKSFDFNSYTDGISFVNSIAEISERMNHHADIHIGYECMSLVWETLFYWREGT